MYPSSLGPQSSPLSPHDQARSDFIDKAGELVASAQQAGVDIDEIRVDFEALLSVIPPTVRWTLKPSAHRGLVQYSDSGLEGSAAWIVFQRMTELAARCALGDGLDATSIALSLHSLADAIEDPGQVAEDMSKIVVPME